MWIHITKHASKPYLNEMLLKWKFLFKNMIVFIYFLRLFNKVKKILSSEFFLIQELLENMFLLFKENNQKYNVKQHLKCIIDLI